MARFTAKKKKNSRIKLIIFLLVLIIIIYGFLSIMFYLAWRDRQKVFHDVTVELGTKSLTIEDFLTEEAMPSRVGFISDTSVINIGQIGQTEIILRHGTQKHIVTLTVQDTIAPTANILKEKSIDVSSGIPVAASLVSNIVDESKVRVFYEERPAISQDYSDVEAVVVLEDEGGNQYRGSCILSFTGWLEESITVEAGTELTPEMVLKDPERGVAFLDMSRLKEISKAGMGEHTLTVSTGHSEATCIITLVDTTPPILKLQNIRRWPGRTATINDLISYVYDASGTPTVRLLTELPNFNEEGKYTVTIEAVDANGYSVQESAIIWVSDNTKAPEIRGIDRALTTTVGKKPDFTKDVWVIDDEDKNCELTVDSSKLDLDTPGIYSITYSALDNSGNMSFKDRNVIVRAG